LEYTNWKIKIVYDIDKLKQFNINPKDIDLFLLGLQTSSNYKWNWIFIKNLNDFGEDIIPLKGYVDLKTNFDKEGAFLNLNSILIPGTNVYLSQVIKKIKFNPEIKYFRYMDWILVLRVEAYKVPDLTLWEITKQINKILENYPEIKLTYSSDVKDMKQSMLDLKNAFLVWILLMFAVLVLNFWNYWLSLIVFSCIPLLFIWAFLLLIVMWLPFGFAAQLGMFGLIWVWVNDAILLIERYNEKIKENLGEKSFYNIDKILLDTVNSRLKPVFLTTITTVLWLITLAIKDALWGSLAIAFMGWLFTWTLITLVYIPAMLKVCYFRKINQI
jgi:multidrug efflux pump subunit AcrB